MRKLNRTGLIKKVDRLFSRYIRKKYAKEGGWCVCVTCGIEVHRDECHAGHFVRRGHHAVRWDERNVHPQCVHCNTYLDGNEGEYARYIIDTYGREVLDELLAAKRLTKKWTMDELRELVEQYSEGG
jgi:hypothetical protein